MTKTADPGDAIPAYVPDFLIVPTMVAFDNELQPLDSKVYGVVSWLETLSQGKCTASNKTIGEIVGSSSSGVANALVRLRDQKYIICHYDDKEHRTGINTLVHLKKTPYSNEEGGVTQMSNRKKNTKREYISSETDEERTGVHRLYRGYLIEFVIGHGLYDYADKDAQAAQKAEAAKKYRLTPKRETAILRQLRQPEVTVEMCAMAIMGYASDPFYRGEKGGTWKAELEWIFKSYENIERGITIHRRNVSND